MLQFGALRHLPPRVTSAHKEVLLALQVIAVIADSEMYTAEQVVVISCSKQLTAGAASYY